MTHAIYVSLILIAFYAGLVTMARWWRKAAPGQLTSNGKVYYILSDDDLNGLIMADNFGKGRGE